MDRKLPLHRRMGINIHLMMCYLCRRYKKQLLFLRSILQAEEQNEEINGASLSPEAKEKIRKKLEEESQNKKKSETP